MAQHAQLNWLNVKHPSFLTNKIIFISTQVSQIRRFFNVPAPRYPVEVGAATHLFPGRVCLDIRLLWLKAGQILNNPCDPAEWRWSSVKTFKVGRGEFVRRLLQAGTYFGKQHSVANKLVFPG